VQDNSDATKKAGDDGSAAWNLATGPAGVGHIIVGCGVGSVETDITITADEPNLDATVTFVVVNGAPVGGQASATIKTDPGVQCIIVYTTPSGTVSNAEGLGSAPASGDGTITWSWEISPGTNVGIGQIAVTCGGFTGFNAIQIG
jgi:hypothetical protein